MSESPAFYALAVVAVTLIGLSKGGFVGLGGFALPLVALAISPVRAAAILLPIMIVQDMVGVWAFRRDWDGRILAWMLPGAAIGTGLGYLFAARVSVDAVLGAVGAISILFGLYRLWIERGGSAPLAKKSPGWVGALFGIGSGFTSQIALAGQPPFQLWVMPQRLPRDTLVGTTAIFFAVCNWFKLPAYWGLGQFTTANLLASLLLLPIAVAATFAGVWLVRRTAPERFYSLIYGLMILLGVKLVWNALT